MSCQPSPQAQVRSLTRRGTIAVVLLFALSGCSVEIEPASQVDSRPDAPWADFDLIDLTHSLGPDSLYWPNGSQFEYERQIWGHAEDGKWYAMGYFATPEHLGTHLDAPIHFAEDRWTNSDIPLERFFAPAVVIDISARAAEDPDTGLLPEDIEGWVERHGPLPEGSVVIVRTGWSDKWPDWNAYYGSEDPFDTTTLRFPGVSAAGAEQLVSAGVVGVGIDTASIDPGQDAEFESHRVLAEAQLFNLENLTNVGELPENGAWVIALPAKIGGGSGAPARVVALVPADGAP